MLKHRLSTFVQPFDRRHAARLCGDVRARHLGPALRLLMTGAILLACGCYRGYYRETADVDAYNLIDEKASHPHWQLPRREIAIDPRSRMFDPFDPDQPPMPPDDPASHQLMHYIDGKKGYPWWHENGDVDTVESPCWRESLILDENGVLNLTAEEAYQLALIHSRDYQQQFETLYLSALDVSAERFRFDTQFFGGYSTFATFTEDNSILNASTFTQQTGRLGPPAGGVSATPTGNLLARRYFSTGADLAVGIANSLVWNFDGTNTFTPTTLLNVSFIQPLLRNAGRDRILEQLTTAERSLLSNVRQIERYRRAYYVEIMTGRDSGTGATRSGGVLGGSGLEGFTGVGSTGFSGLGGGGGGGAANAGFGGGGAGAAQAGNYFGLLQTQQDIRNQQITIAGLRSNLVQLRESLQENLRKIPDDVETIVRERLQIAQARQALLNAESRLLISQATYAATLDNFKRTLGLPPTLCVNIHDTMLDRFNLISTDTINLQNEITALRDRMGTTNQQILSLVQTTDGARTLAWSDELAVQLLALRNIVTDMRSIKDRASTGVVRVTREDIAALVGLVPDRKRDLLSLRTKYRQELDRFTRYGGLDPCQVTLLADLDPSVFDTERLEAMPAELDAELLQLQDKFMAYDGPLQAVEDVIANLLNAPTKPEPPDLYLIIEKELLFALPALLSDMSDDILDVSLIQARARTHTVSVPPIDLDWGLAIEMARKYRHDWMNQRSALVDRWRRIEFTADNLDSVLDLVFNGTLRDDATTDSVQMGLRFDAPLTRLQERNTYRQALIEFQQARRSYYAYEDGVTQSLRGTLRTLELNRINFEERRLAVLSAIEQVVLNDQLGKLREERGLDAGVTAARDVVSALADLQTAQNDFLNVWVNYEVQRLNLDLDLGTMNLDENGNWIDPGPIGPEYGYPMPQGFECEPNEFHLPGTTEPELLPPGPPGPEMAPLPEPVLEDGAAMPRTSSDFGWLNRPYMERLPAVRSPVIPASAEQNGSERPMIAR